MTEILINIESNINQEEINEEDFYATVKNIKNFITETEVIRIDLIELLSEFSERNINDINSIDTFREASQYNLKIVINDILFDLQENILVYQFIDDFNKTYVEQAVDKAIEELKNDLYNEISQAVESYILSYDIDIQLERKR